MKYILNENIALRSWWLVPHAYYIRHRRFAAGLKKEEFDILRCCDGIQELDDSLVLRRLIEKKFCRAAKEGETLTEWQRHKICDNRYMPAMNWMITGKCNYNCLHCFNAADNTPLMSEWSLKEAEKLLNEAEQCGINAFTITGGEPMLHKNFLELLEEIYRRGMYVDELNTNGYFISQQILDRMKAIGCIPLMKISFDGIGHHDWLRNKKGAEETALQAIRLCIENGFPVKVQTNVHRKNVDSMLETAKLMDQLGVHDMRIIRTSESPRWSQNAGEATLELMEYFDHMLQFAKAYQEAGCNMEVTIWQFMTLYPREKAYLLRAVQYQEEEYRDSIPVCKGNRGMIAVAANGQIYPCHQMSGYYEGHGWDLGNVKNGSLQEALRGGKYLSEICTTVKDLAEHNSVCAACKFFKYCCGGCRAIGTALTGDKMGSDMSKCLFYKQGYYQKAINTMGSWKNLTPIKEV